MIYATYVMDGKTNLTKILNQYFTKKNYFQKKLKCQLKSSLFLSMEH